MAALYTKPLGGSGDNTVKVVLYKNLLADAERCLQQARERLLQLDLDISSLKYRQLADAVPKEQVDSVYPITDAKHRSFWRAWIQNLARPGDFPYLEPFTLKAPTLWVFRDDILGSRAFTKKEGYPLSRWMNGLQDMVFGDKLPSSKSSI